MLKQNENLFLSSVSRIIENDESESEVSPSKNKCVRIILEYEISKELLDEDTDLPNEKIICLKFRVN